MQISFKFLCTKTGKAAILKLDDRTYVFNVFEGFQRYSIEEQFSIASSDVVFLSSKDCVPGLIGMHLSLCETTKDQLDVVSNFEVNLFKKHKANILFDPTFHRGSFSDKFIKVNLFDLHDGTTNFILELPEIKGKLYPERIPSQIPRTLYKKLVADEFLEFEGELYNLRDFSDPKIAFNKIGLIFSEITDESQLDQVPADLKCFICFTASSYTHLAPRMNSSEQLLQKADPINFQGVYRVVENKFVEFKDFYSEQVKMNEKDPRFLVPERSCGYSTQLKEEQHQACDDSDLFTLQTGDQLIFNKVHNVHIKRSSEHVAGVMSKYTPVFPCVEFLGTGCSVPSKYRNVSSILYQNETSAILLDCGEDTLAQILRLHGDLCVLEKIKVIYISHSHRDHMLGVASIVKRIPGDVLLIAPYDTQEFLEYFGMTVHQVQHSDSISLQGKVNLFSTTFVKQLEQNFYADIQAGQKNDWNNYISKIGFGEFEFTICGCKHSKTSVSVNIQDLSVSKSFSYSGDTVPSLLFAYISSFNDLMIHEATFLDEQREQANNTSHSLKSEAREIFELAGSKKLLLTHFSNRNRADDSDDDCVRDFFRYVFD